MYQKKTGVRSVPGMLFNKKALAIVTGMAAAQMSGLAIAQQDNSSSGIEEIVVTGDKRGDGVSIQDAGYNISAVTADTLEKANAEGIADIASLVPGVSVVDQGPNNRQLVIRGLTSSAGAAQTSSYVDEMPLSYDLELDDVERVEVLRGPQGTLYGSGSQGGTIRYILNKPNLEEFSGSVDVGVGTRSRNAGENKAAHGMLNFPLITDKLAVRLVAFDRSTDGYVRLPDAGLSNTDKVKRTGGRLMARWQIADSTRFDFVYFNQKTALDDLPEVNLSSDMRPGVVLNGSLDKVDMFSATLSHEFELGTLTATTTSFKQDSNFEFDVTQFAPPGFLGSIGAAGMAVNQPANNKTKTAEIRFNSNLSGPFQFLLGLYNEDVEATNFSRTNYRASNGAVVPGPLFFSTREDVNNKSKAVFGEVTYQVNDDLELVAGIRRYDIDRHSQPITFGDLRADNPTLFPDLVAPDTSKADGNIYRLQANWRLSDDVLTYATISEGFREGGENPLFIEGNVPRTFAPDFVTNYEIGVKSLLLDQQLLFNAAVYYMEFKDIQTANADATNRFDFTTNSGAADLKGVEVETEWQPEALSGFSASFNFRWSQQKLTKDNPLASTNPFAGVKGNSLPNTYEEEAALTLQQQFTVAELDAFASLTATYQGEALTTLSPNDPSARKWGDFTLVGGQLGVESESWHATLYVRNLFDVREPVSWVVQLEPGLEDRIFTTQPREVGVNVGFKF